VTAPGSPAARLNRISEEGLCIGCGLCQALAGEAMIAVVRTSEGSLRPVATEALDHPTVDAIYAVCPGTRLEGLPERHLDPDTEIDAIWGPTRRIVKGHAGDPEIRFKAAAGGALTALSLQLLESGLADFILHATESETDPSFGARHVSRTRDDLLRGAGSRYGPTATLIDIDHWLARAEEADERFAFVGTPCDVSALRNLATRDPRVDARCVMMMTMVCGGFMETPALARAVAGFGLDFERLTHLRYRGYGCPGPTRMEQDDGAVVEKTYLDFWGEDDSAWSLPWRCKICPDAIGEAADIAASDCWPGGAPTRAQAEDHGLDPGSNGILVRSARGQALFDAAVASGALVVESEATARDMDDWQPHQVHKKRSVGARFEGMRRAGHIVPRTERLRVAALMAENDPAANAAQIEGTAERVRAGKASEPTPRRA
jgi:coenzyme F420 hydrogenase subunit beta